MILNFCGFYYVEEMSSKGQNRNGYPCQELLHCSKIMLIGSINGKIYE